MRWSGAHQSVAAVVASEGGCGRSTSAGGFGGAGSLGLKWPVGWLAWRGWLSARVPGPNWFRSRRLSACVFF